MFKSSKSQNDHKHKTRIGIFFGAVPQPLTALLLGNPGTQI